MQLSILIVNYNAGTHLKTSVSSALKVKDSEVIVVDNASTDNSIKVLTSLKVPYLKIIKNLTNLGFAKAVNQAAKLAKGDYLFLLNPDAVLSQRAVSQLLQTSQDYHDEAIIAPALANEDGTLQSSCYHRQSISNALREFYFGIKGAYSKYLPSINEQTTVDIAVAAAWLINKSVWQKLGGLSEKFFLYFEDLDFCDRASKLGIPVIYEPRAIVIHAHGVSAKTNPATNALFLNAATLYHGKAKKMIIDLIIRSSGFLRGEATVKKATLVWLTTFALALAVAVLGYLLLPMRYSPAPTIPDLYNQNFLLWSWANFDGEHYLSIAKEGYQTYKGQSQYAFFPLLPSLINLFSRFGLDLYLSARLFTLTSSLVAIIAIAKWTSRYTQKSLESAWTYLLSSGGVFLFSVYTEPVFVMLAALTFLAVENKQWGRAILTTALATATRINGVILIPFLMYSLYRAKKSWGQIIPSSVLSCTGLLAYTTYLYYQTGNPLAWYRAQGDWGKAQVAPFWETISRYFSAVTIEFVPDLTHLVVVIEVITTITLTSLFIWALKTKVFPSAYNVYLLGNLVLPLITGSLGSMPRFALTLFPLYLVVQNTPAVVRFILRTSFLIFWILGIILFTRGYWYA